MNWTAAAAVTLASAVMIGAFGAHGLEGRLDPYSLGVYETAVRYHFYHALGLLAVPLLVRTGLVRESAGRWAGWLLLVGIVFFCGSLYVLALTGVTMLGAVAPVGGTAFIAGWVMLGWGAVGKK